MRCAYHSFTLQQCNDDKRKDIDTDISSTSLSMTSPKKINIFCSLLSIAIDQCIGVSGDNLIQIFKFDNSIFYALQHIINLYDYWMLNNLFL